MKRYKKSQKKRKFSVTQLEKVAGVFDASLYVKAAYHQIPRQLSQVGDYS